MRIGHGYDAHRFTDGHEVIIGGVHIAHDQALLAHSDGDVLIHAVCDALLGAAGLGDIGRHFPDTHTEFKDINSRILLKDIVTKLQKKGLTVSNADMTIIAQTPKMATHIISMEKNLAIDMQIPPDRVNVKATTTEKMGFTGRKEGIACHAVVLLNE